VRRDADAGAGSEVDDDVALEQLLGDQFAVRDVDGDGAAAALRVLGRVDAPAAGVRLLVEMLRETHGLFASRRDADLVVDLQAGAGGIETRNLRRAVQEAPRVAAPAYRRRLERERCLVRHPAGQVRLELRRHVGVDVEENVAGAAAEPFQAAAHRRIDPPFLGLDRDDAGGLEHIEQQKRTAIAAAACDSLGVVDVGALEFDVAHRHGQRLVIDRGQELIRIGADAVGARN
jgi:hypothetical protein